MVYTESKFSHLSYSTVGHGRTDSPTFIDDAFTPISGIGVAIPYPVLQRTFLLDPTPPPSPVHQKFKYTSSATSSTIQGQQDLITFDKLPEWSQDNPHIHSGYRQISHSTSTCLHSCVQIHNETFNIWSHFIPCILFIILEGIIMYYLNTRYPNATIKDHIIFSFFILCATICLGISAIFHSLISHSQKGRDLWLKLDYVGIVFLIIGCFISAVYMSFFCQQTLQYAYCGMILAMSSTALVFLLLPAFQGHRWRSFRVVAFCATAVSVLIPFVHTIAQSGWDKAMEQSGMPYYFAEALLLLVGVVCFAKRWPESWIPGSFDLLGNSHQIFHLLVVLAMVLHFVGLLQAFNYNYAKGECRGTIS
ncbi:uncharacterized protein EAF02_001235 [Botrytis sinoallii]|uniref:uncharacterized protein n=1 Tax=Botrytis sinoallii TaxID=1463999 RepID=UPI0018FF45CD|nr:uncharacterized protein EAF02_001235 [Botrytis sinoallii]KAF7893697.1 hypothetical protein EAF02_001235 [Botrytis sinoallii]